MTIFIFRHIFATTFFRDSKCHSDYLLRVFLAVVISFHFLRGIRVEYVSSTVTSCCRERIR